MATIARMNELASSFGDSFMSLTLMPNVKLTGHGGTDESYLLPILITKHAAMLRVQRLVRFRRRRQHLL
jgi:hypothetical protein